MAKDLTQGRIMPMLIKFTIPLILGNIFQLTYNAVDSIIVGRFVGKEALGAHLAQFSEKTNGTFKVLTNWVSENIDLVAANVTFVGTRPDGEELNMNGIDLFRMDDGKIKEVWLFSSDQAVEDAFWG